MKTKINSIAGKLRSLPRRPLSWLAVIATVLSLNFVSSCKEDEPQPPNLTITSFSPTTGGPGTVVELIGAGFSTTASENAVSLNGKACTVTNATATKLTITIPAEGATGPISITVGGKTAQRGTFTFVPNVIPLAITSIAPTSGPKNTVVTINGTGFSTTLSQNSVTINGKVCPVTAATATSLTIIIPAAAGTGNLVVSVGGGTPAQSSTFTFIPLAVTSISPTTGPKNTVVTVVGTGFSATPANNEVTINNKVCAVSAATETQLAITIPAGAGSGVLKVTVSGDLVESQNFDFVFTINTSTFAGSSEGSDDGTGTAAKFKKPHDLVFDASGNLYVTDGDNHKIRKITPAGVVSTFAGSSYGFSDGPGSTAQFQFIKGIAIDGNGNLYVADENSQRIRKITPAGVVSTLAGSGAEGSDDNAIGTSATFRYPTGVAVDASGNVYVADKDNHRIRKITPNGVVTTLAGSSEGSADGNGTSAQFKKPFDVVLDASGNIYVSDSDNHKIRKITSAGQVTTFAGSSYGFTDGAASTAQFQFIKGIAIDGNGNLYVADENSQRIRKITPAGVVSTLAGTGSEGSTDGTGSTSQFNYPTGVAVDSNGNVYVADKDNHRIRKITID